MRKKRICIVFLLVVIVALWVDCAGSEAVQTVMPAGAPLDAESIAEERFGDLRFIRLSSKAGETMIMLSDDEGLPICLITESAASVEQGGTQTTDDATAAVRAAFPDALILKVESEGTLKAVSIATPYLFGTLWTSGGQVVRRKLRGGCFIADGRLTLDGAYHIAQLIQSEAVFIAFEYNAEDDTYEADALVNGVEYELELDARTGKLLEWERD